MFSANSTNAPDTSRSAPPWPAEKAAITPAIVECGDRPPARCRSDFGEAEGRRKPIALILLSVAGSDGRRRRRLCRPRWCWRWRSRRLRRPVALGGDAGPRSGRSRSTRPLRRLAALPAGIAAAARRVARKKRKGSASASLRPDRVERVTDRGTRREVTTAEVTTGRSARAPRRAGTPRPAQLGKSALRQATAPVIGIAMISARATGLQCAAAAPARRTSRRRRG